MRISSGCSYAIAVFAIALFVRGDVAWGAKRASDPELRQDNYKSTYKEPERRKSYTRSPNSGGSGFRWPIPYSNPNQGRPRYYPQTQQGRPPIRVRPPVVAPPNTPPPAPPQAQTEVRRNAPPSQDFKANLRTSDGDSDYFDEDPGGPVVDFSSKDGLPPDDEINSAGLGAFEKETQPEAAEEESRPEPKEEKKPLFPSDEKADTTATYEPEPSTNSGSGSSSKSKTKGDAKKKSTAQAKSGGGKSSGESTRKKDPRKINSGTDSTGKKASGEGKHLGTFVSPKETSTTKPGGSSTTRREPYVPPKDRGSVGDRSTRRQDGGNTPTAKKEWINTDRYRQETDSGHTKSGFDPYDAFDPARPGQQSGDISVFGGSEKKPGYQPNPLNPKPAPNSIQGGIGINLPGDHDKSREFRSDDRSRNPSSGRKSGTAKSSRDEAKSSRGGSIVDKLTPRKPDSWRSTADDQVSNPTSADEREVVSHPDVPNVQHGDDSGPSILSAGEAEEKIEFVETEKQVPDSDKLLDDMLDKHRQDRGEEALDDLLKKYAPKVLNNVINPARKAKAVYDAVKSDEIGLQTRDILRNDLYDSYGKLKNIERDQARFESQYGETIDTRRDRERLLQLREVMKAHHAQTKVEVERAEKALQADRSEQ